MRRDATEVAFRCRTCDPDALSTRMPLDAPAFGALLGDVRRPSAVRARVAAWTDAYWVSADPSCVRCDRPVSPRPYVRDDGGELVGPPRLVRRVRRLRRGGHRVDGRAHAGPSGGPGGARA